MSTFRRDGLPRHASADHGNPVPAKIGNCAMKIIITGAAGFIGSAVCRYLPRETDASIVCLDKMTYAANPDTLASIVDGARALFEPVDICNRAEVERVFREHQPD